MEREQIIKALECCTRGRKNKEDRPCLECPYNECNLVGGTSERQVTGTCQGWLMKDALSLIKELTEENKAWQMQLISKEEKADKAYYDLACEVEDLRAENERLRDTAYRLECEVHRERANTVRKMQDEVNRAPDILDVNGYRMIGVDIVDLIVKRMLEGKE